MFFASSVRNPFSDLLSERFNLTSGALGFAIRFLSVRANIEETYARSLDEMIVSIPQEYAEFRNSGYITPFYQESRTRSDGSLQFVEEIRRQIAGIKAMIQAYQEEFKKAQKVMVEGDKKLHGSMNALEFAKKDYSKMVKEVNLLSAEAGNLQRPAKVIEYRPKENHWDSDDSGDCAHEAVVVFETSRLSIFKKEEKNPELEKLIGKLTQASEKKAESSNSFQSLSREYNETLKAYKELFEKVISGIEKMENDLIQKMKSSCCEFLNLSIRKETGSISGCSLLNYSINEREEKRVSYRQLCEKNSQALKSFSFLEFDKFLADQFNEDGSIKEEPKRQGSLKENKENLNMSLDSNKPMRKSIFG